MKKTWIALLLLFAFALSGCGNTGEKNAPESATSSTPSESITQSASDSQSASPSATSVTLSAEPLVLPATVPEGFSGPLELAKAVQEELVSTASAWYNGMGEEEKKIIRRAIKGLERQNVLPQFDGFTLPEGSAFSVAIWIDLPDLFEWPIFVEEVQPNVQEFLTPDEGDATEGYRRALENRIDNALTRLLDEEEDLPLREEEIVLDIRQEGENWVASLRPTTMIEITESVRRDLTKKVDLCFRESDYQTIYAAQALRAYVDKLPFPAELVEIIHNMDEKYSLTLSHPDPDEYYSKAADKVIEELRETYKDGLYGKISDAFLTEALAAQAAAIEDVEQSRTTMIIHYTGKEAAWEAESSPEFLRFVLEYEDKCVAVLPYVRERIRDLQHSAQDEPETGVISGVREGARFRVYLPEDEKHCYVRALRLEGDDISGESSYQQGAFIVQGDMLSSRLPNGKYLLKIARGENWYGEEAVFGHFGEYYRVSKVVEIRDGGSFSLHLEEEEDQALLEAVSYEDFQQGPPIPPPEEKEE